MYFSRSEICNVIVQYWTDFEMRLEVSDYWMNRVSTALGRHNMFSTSTNKASHNGYGLLLATRPLHFSWLRHSQYFVGKQKPGQLVTR